jgi:serine/threonine protein phosphatase PrpC
VRYACKTDQGRVRENNEDSWRAQPELGLFVVADGMGGHIAGEVASSVAADTLVDVVRSRKRPRRAADEAPLLGEAVLVAHNAVGREATERGLLGMGTTLTALLVRGRTGTVAHVGDSRASLVQRRGMKRLTRDHTLAEMLVETGAISPREAMTHPERHVLTQAIGPNAQIEPDILQTRLRPGVRVLLSSDGLHDVVLEEEIHALARIEDLDEAVNRLVARTLELGAPDNVTVILVEP